MSSKNVVLKDTFGNQIFPATTAEQVSYDATKNMKQALDTVNAHATVANEAANMTDETKIYVYTGSETGYTYGHWYYHDGSTWTDGGVYMSGDTDTTLSLSGIAADAAVVGAAFDAITTATADDEGKALKAKTVTDGKVSEWEFGDTGTPVEIDPTLSKEGSAADAKAAGIAIGKLKEDVGNLSNLTTTAKNNLVAAINEAAQTGAAIARELPKLYINGDISLSNKDADTKEYNYIFEDAEGKRYFGYCSIKWQGESSLQYPKKNYTLKFFFDSAYKRKESVDLIPALGITKKKFVVKANWVDRTMARNIVSCRLWAQMVKSRHTAPPELLAAAPNWGAINGYPVRVYVNDEFHGLYTFNIPKDEDLFGMDVENPLHCVVCGDNNQNTDSNSAAFRSAIIGTSWELEVPDEWPKYTTEEDGQTVTHAVKDNLSDTIAFVINATDEEFIAGLNDHIDVESAIDYFLMMFLECGIDSAARNLIMLTYDGGQKWFCSAYDKDLTWGNGSMGAPTYNAQLPCPSGYINNNSLLWERLTTLFGDAISERWNELKSTILDPDYIKAEFEYFWKDINDSDYAADVEKWPDMPQKTVDFKLRISNFISERWTYMDGVIKSMRTPVACTGITLDKSTVSFTNGDPVTLTATVEPENTTDDVVWTSSNTDVAVISNGVITPVGEGSATITATCGNQTATCTVTVSNLYYTVSLVGTGATLTPEAHVIPNSVYYGTLAANSGYAIDSVLIEMGGVDITSSAYDNGSITVGSVTGNIVVTVSTSISIDPTGLQYSLPSPVTFDGQTYIDTGYKYSGTGDLSVFFETENPQDMSTVQNLFGQKTNTTARFCMHAPHRTLEPALNGGNLQTGAGATVGTRYKVVFRYDANRSVQSNRSAADGVEKTNRYCINSNGVQTPRDAWGNNLYIGGINNDGTLVNPMLSGKLYQMRIYERRLTDAETMALLGIDTLSDVITADKDQN